MADLYPLLLQPEFKERVWGARDLSPLYERKVAAEQAPIGEVWLTGDACCIANGALSGKTLAEATRQFGRTLVGEAAPHAEQFPLLTKFLFPRGKLSVQVHPDDAAAKRLGQPCGKTECWYALAAEHGAKVGLGLKPGTTREALRQAIEQMRAEELLRWLPVRAGDMLYADAGTVHTIGPGMVLLETQQNSDVTYRLYDYGRGRPLHIAEGLAVMKETTNAGKVVLSSDDKGNLITSPYFVVNRRTLTHGKEQLLTRHMPPTSAQVLVALRGAGEVVVKGMEPVKFHRGEAVVVPACIIHFGVRPQPELEYLHIMLPQEAVEPPRTTLIE